MPNPIATYSALKFLWTESKPIREWIWAKLPSVQDSRKREKVEDQLAKLLDDANALARALPESDRDRRIEERIGAFREELIQSRMPTAEVDILVERATMFVRMLVLGPYAEIISLRQRIAELEQMVQSQEQAMGRNIAAFETKLAEIDRKGLQLARVAWVSLILATACLAWLVILLLWN